MGRGGTSGAGATKAAAVGGTVSVPLRGQRAGANLGGARVRRVSRSIGRGIIRLLVVVIALVAVGASVAAFTARDVDGPWTPVDGVCFRRVERVAFARITIDQHFAIASMRLCEEAPDASS